MTEAEKRELKKTEFCCTCSYLEASYISLQRRILPSSYLCVAKQHFMVEREFAHIFSMTKSFVGLVYVHLLLTEENFPLETRLTDVPLFAAQFSREGMQGARVIDLINHTSGMLSGRKPGKFTANDVMLFITDPSVHEVMHECIHGFDTPGEFAYNNYGSFLFGVVLEDIMRQEQIDAGKTPNWYIFEAAHRLGLFGELQRNRDYLWPVHSGVGLMSHSAAFAGIKFSPAAATYIGKHLLDNFKPLLEFIQGDREVEFNGKKFKNAYRVRASGRHICATASGAAADEGAKPERPMDYSLGFWIPVIEGRRVLTMIGMLGQFIAWDLDNDLVVVRMHYLDLDDFKPRNKHRDFVWDAMEFLWDYLKL